MNVEKIKKWNIHNLDTIFLSPTNKCNYKCIMCPNSKLRCKRGFLSWNLFKRIINELSCFYEGSDFFELHLYNEGEPFLHSRYVDMLEYIDSTIKNTKVLISTNAYFLDKEKMNRILKLHRNNYVVIFSIDASNKELYDQIRLKGNYMRIEENISYFLRKKKENNINNPYAVLQFIVMPINKYDMHNFYCKWNSMLGPFIRDSYIVWSDDLLSRNSAHIHWKKYHEMPTSQITKKYIFSDENNKESQVFSDKYFSLNSECHPHICAWLWKRLVIGWDGGVGLCCFHWESNGIAGNLNNESLKKIFKGKKINRLRWLFLNKKYHQIPICSNCEKKHWWYNPGLEDYFEL